MALMGVAAARDIPYSSFLAKAKREVPLEQSHFPVVRNTSEALQLNNPLEIVDAVFGLLGDAAAATGAPNVDDLDCLQQIIADQAFTNAKEINDLELMTNAILYRSLERNTLSVGLASPLCTQKAVNPEIASISQHQDPASPEAVGNKQIALNVAISLASIGADPNIAILSGTFAPGEIGDPTAAGNTCNVEGDVLGCIISQNLLVPDVTEDEIAAAVAGAGAGNGADAGNNNVACPVVGANNNTANNNAGNQQNNNAGNGNGNNAPSATVNVQTFTGTLGGAAPPVISSDADRPFAVNGATFLNAGAALQRSCAVQKNACANAANSGQIQGGTGQCDTQENACRAASAARRTRKQRRQNQRFGSCSDPSIVFDQSPSDRQQPAFVPGNSADFNHGSALNIAVISNFICSQLGSKCKANATTVAACNAAAGAAAGAQGAAAASAFNSALGV